MQTGEERLIEFAKRDIRHTRSRLTGLQTLPTVAPQQSGNVITFQQALATGTTPEQLRAVANWNERKSHDERRRKARMRHRAQAEALREVAGRLDDEWLDRVVATARAA